MLTMQAIYRENLVLRILVVLKDVKTKTFSTFLERKCIHSFLKEKEIAKINIHEIFI